MNDSPVAEITSRLDAVALRQCALLESQAELNKRLSSLLHLLELQKIGTALAVESFKESLVKQFGGDVVANWLKKIVSEVNQDSGVLMT